MVKKFFPLDKNYLLEQAQLAARPILLQAMVDTVKQVYEYKLNPLGLLDSFAQRIRDTPTQNLHLLFDLYDKLAAIYRFKHGDNQLNFLWDGQDHPQHYSREWAAKFSEWVERFCRHDLFIQAVLDFTVFCPAEVNPQMLETRMQHFITKHLEVKFHKTKGILAA